MEGQEGRTTGRDLGHAAKSFCREEEGVKFKPFGPRRRVPPVNEGFDCRQPSVGWSGKELERQALEIGCIAFSSKSGRYFNALANVEHWVNSDSADDQVHVIESPFFPWHLVDLNLRLRESPQVLQSISIQVECFHDVPQDVNLYFCFLGGNTNNGHFYLGLQTRVGTPGSPNAGPRIRQPSQTNLSEWPQAPFQEPVGGDYGAIFSRFGDANLGDVAIPDSASFAEAADYEGDFSSVRRHGNFLRKGMVSTLRLQVENSQPGSANGSWVRFEIEPKNEPAQIVGWLFFHGSQPLRLADSWLYNFTEIYARPLSTFALPAANACSFMVSNLKINDVIVEPPATEAEYWRQVPLFARCSRNTGNKEWHVHTDVVPCSGLSYGSKTLW